MTGVQGSGVQGGGEIPPGDVVVADGEPISVRNVNGLDPHNGTAVVTGDPPVLQSIHLPSGTAMLDDGEVTAVANADGTLLYPAIADVANGLVTFVALGPTLGVVTADEQITVTSGSSSTTGNIMVGNGHVVDVTLQTAALVEPNQTLSVHNSSDTKDVDGSAHITGGTFDYVTLPATAALVLTADTVALANDLGSSRGNVTPNINSGFLTNVHLPNQVDIVANGDTKPLSKADNTGLLAMVTANIPSGTDTLENWSLPATVAAIANAASVQVENQGATQNVQGTVAVALNVMIVKLPPSAALVANGVGIAGAPVTGIYVDTITPQVNAAGVITGFVLS